MLNPFGSSFDTLTHAKMLMFIFIIHTYLSFIFGLIYKFKINRNANR